MLRGVLPTRMRLQDKGVPCTNSYPHCETNYENDWHVFIGCEEAKKVWQAAGLWGKISEVAASAANYAECIFTLLCRLTGNENSDMAMMLWCLWRRRNDKVWDGDLKTIEVAIKLARDLLLQWISVRHKEEQQQPHQQHQNIVWQPPEIGYLKCNIDAAIFEDQRSFGIGMCLRNSNGHFVKASTMWFDGVPPPIEAEAMGLRVAILWLGQLGLSNVQIELDCKLVVDSIVDRTNSQSKFGKIISECVSLLQQYTNFKISFVRRQVNCAAHSLARASKLYARHHMFDLIPSCITTIVMNEII